MVGEAVVTQPAGVTAETVGAVLSSSTVVVLVGSVFPATSVER